MTTYKEVELKLMMKKNGSVTITVVNENDESFDETHDNIDEAIQAINTYEIENTVYF